MEWGQRDRPAARLDALREQVWRDFVTPIDEVVEQVVAVDHRREREAAVLGRLPSVEANVPAQTGVEGLRVAVLSVQIA